MCVHVRVYVSSCVEMCVRVCVCAGQPVLIGGTMGTCSYVLTGTDQVCVCVCLSLCLCLSVFVSVCVLCGACLT